MSKTTPKKVDICMCIKNRGALVQDAIFSLSKQDFPDFNIIVCDGMSSDSTSYILVNLNNKINNMELCQTNKDGKYVDAHNIALSKTTSEYVCWIDSDDAITSDKISNQVKYLDEHPDIDAVTTGVMFSIDGKTALMPNSVVDLSPEEISELIEKKGYSLNDICHFQSVMFRRSCLDKFTNCKYFYDEYEDGRCGDGFMLTLFYLGFRIANIGKVMYAHMLHPSSMTAAIYDKHIFADEVNEKTPGRRKQTIMKLFKKYNG